MSGITYKDRAAFDALVNGGGRHVHLILIATKPDIIKQVPLYKELQSRGHCVLLGHTGQHYDRNLSGGMLAEFGVEPDFNLNVRGAMHEVVSQIIGRLGDVIGELKAAGKIVIPYVHGDTTTAMAAGNAGYCHGFASVHVEAGIRTLTPDYDLFFGDKRDAVPGTNEQYILRDADVNAPDWRMFQLERKHWLRGSQEPYPEQFNTRCSEAATGIHLAPVHLDREFLLAEGFCDDRIFVVGNSVVDATHEALARAQTSTIFDRYPLLADGNFVRFCIHRRENCFSERRFRAIYGAMVELIQKGRNVLLITMIQTDAAFERFHLKADVEALAKKYPNFILSPVWGEYGDVIAAMSKAAVCATDSGSMQEEMNVLGVPCVTLRFGSDRSESAMNGGNIIAPPVSTPLIVKLIEYAWDNQQMRDAAKLYGRDVSKACIGSVESVLKNGEAFRAEEARLHL